MNTPNHKLMRRTAVLEATGLSRSGLYRAMSIDFPVPVKLGARAVAWRSDEVADWIASRKTVGGQA